MKKILVVDDTKINVNILVELLGDIYDVVVALDGFSALNILENEKVDLVLLDIMMPEIDGFEVAKKIQNNSELKDIPIIFITAKTDEQSIEEAYEIGGIDYITKPFKPRELLAKLSREFKLQDTIRHLEYISSHDQMTGILNRRKFFELGEELFRYNSNTLYAVMIDIDKFKNINDSYGHYMGDKVIKCVASTIQQQLSEGSIFGRLGGEEFAILFDLPMFEDIEKDIESLRKQIELQSLFTDENKEVKFTISQGVARKTDDTKILDQLLKQADDALYEAKGMGRNKVILRS